MLNAPFSSVRAPRRGPPRIFTLAYGIGSLPFSSTLPVILPLGPFTGVEAGGGVDSWAKDEEASRVSARTADHAAHLNLLVLCMPKSSLISVRATQPFRVPQRGTLPRPLSHVNEFQVPSRFAPVG